MARTKTDKIFDNNFEATDFELDANITFTISSQFSDDREEDEKIIQQSLQIDIHSLIELSRFKVFNQLTEFSDSRRLKKNDINDVYNYIHGELIAKYGQIEIFSELSDYFNINPTKFYSSLSNVFKESLILELDQRTGILKSRNIHKLF
jgi:hypothetical protein